MYQLCATANRPDPTPEETAAEESEAAAKKADKAAYMRAYRGDPSSPNLESTPEETAAEKADKAAYMRAYRDDSSQC